jgi:hypothetical protein
MEGGAESVLAEQRLTIRELSRLSHGLKRENEHAQVRRSYLNGLCLSSESSKDKLRSLP